MMMYVVGCVLECVLECVVVCVSMFSSKAALCGGMCGGCGTGVVACGRCGVRGVQVRWMRACRCGMTGN